MEELLPCISLSEKEGIGLISQLAFSPTGLLAIGGHKVDLWDLSGGTVSNHALATFSGADMTPLAFSPDGRFLALGRDDGCVIFNVATATTVQEHRHNGAARVLAWSPDGLSLASCSEYGQFHIWQIENGEVIHQRRFEVPPAFLLWLPDGRLATNPFTMQAPTCFRWQVQLWNAAQAQEEHLIDEKEWRCDAYTCAAFAPRRAQLALGTQDGAVQIWRVEKGTAPVCERVIRFHTNAISGLAWSPDETLLSTGSLDGHVALWKTQDGKLLYHTGARAAGGRGIQDVVWWKDLLAVASEQSVALYRVSQTDHFLL